MALQKNSCVILFSFLVAARYFDESSSLKYRVGDSVWSIPPYPHYYSDWSSNHLFYIGDSLVFDFEMEFSNLIEVEPLDYQTCTANNPMKIFNSGPATILLQEAGVFYFMCNLSNYCELGQKISIIVQDRRANFPPTPSPSPSPLSIVFSPTPVACPLPVTPKGPSPEPSTAGNWNSSGSPPPMPARTDHAPSPTTDTGHTNSSSKSCSVLDFSLLRVGVSFSFWVFFWVEIVIDNN